MTDNGMQLFVTLCIVLMVTATVVSWSVMPQRTEPSTRLWFMGAGMLASVGIVHYVNSTWITALFATNVAAAIFALESLKHEQQPQDIAWHRIALIIGVPVLIQFLAQRAVDARWFDNAWLLGPRVLLLAVLEGWILVRALRLSRQRRSRGMFVVMLGMAPLVVVNLIRVVAIAAGSDEMGPDATSRVFPLMAMLLTMAAMTYNFGFLAFELEKSHARQLSAQESAARAEERALVAQTYTAELESVIAQRDQMLMNSTRLAAVSAMGLYNSAIVHEISQPLQALRSVLDGLDLQLSSDVAPSNESLRAPVGQALELSVKASTLIQSLRRLIAARSSAMDSFSPHEAIRAVQPVLLSEARRRGIVLTFDLDTAVESSRVRAEPLLLQRMLMNLIGNSLDALSGHRSDIRAIHLSTGLAAMSSTPAVAIRIEDTGPGFPADVLEGTPQPLTTHKPDGMGLGLTLTRLIMQSWKGSMLLGSPRPEAARDGRPDHPVRETGARVELLIPCG